MKRKIRREIYTKTRKFALILNSKNERRLMCEICVEDSFMLSPIQIAGLFKISTRKIYQLIEKGFVHFYENDSKELLVCLKSIEKALSGNTKNLIKKEGE